MTNKSYLAHRELVLQFMGRFGFITREIFDKHLCQMSRARKFAYFKQFQSDGVITKASSKLDVYYLTKKGRALNPSAVASRSIFFIEHDTIAVEFLALFFQKDIFSQFWTEAELMRNPFGRLKIFGSSITFEKSPDLVLELRNQEKNLKIAIEVERSIKTKNRYDHLALCYSGLEKIDQVIFLCQNKAIKKALKSAFCEGVQDEKQNPPAFILVPDFLKDLWNAEVECGQFVQTLEELILLRTELKILTSKTAVLDVLSAKEVAA